MPYKMPLCFITLQLLSYSSPEDARQVYQSWLRFRWHCNAKISSLFNLLIHYSVYNWCVYS